MSVKQGGKTIAGATQYHPDLFDFKWADHILNDAQWLMANTFSWQYGSMYQAAYANLSAAIVGKTLQSETVAGITVQFYLADDGHKICPASEEDKVLSIYNKTGNAWYYIIDTTNQRFKLPRRHSQQIVRSVKNADGSWYRLYADGWVEQGGQFSIGAGNSPTYVTFPVEMKDTNYQALYTAGTTSVQWATNQVVNPQCVQNTKTTTSCGFVDNLYNNTKATWQVSGKSAIDMSSFQDGEKYLYFYVGAFTQTAIENTAGLNTELFNGKADINLSNVSATTRSGFLFSVSQESMSVNNYYTLTFPEEIDPTKVKVNAYAVVKTANNNFVVGDVIPFESLWGQNYRPISMRLNSTNLQFNTSDQITTNNPNNSGSGINIVSYIRMVFDVYQVK